MQSQEEDKRAPCMPRTAICQVLFIRDRVIQAQRIMLSACEYDGLTKTNIIDRSI